MSSLLGHVLGAEAALGFAGGLAMEPSRWRRGAWLAAVIAVVPDLDVGLYVLAGRPEWLRPHAGPSHSLLFAGLLGLTASAYLLKSQRSPSGGERLGAAGVMTAVAALHLLMDLLSPSPVTAGVPLFWPFAQSPVPFAPLHLLPEAPYATEGFGQLFRSMFLDWRSWAGMIIECVILLPLVALAWRRPGAGSPAWPLAALSLAGVGLSVVLYTVLGVL